MNSWIHELRPRSCILCLCTAVVFAFGENAGPALGKPAQNPAQGPEGRSETIVVDLAAPAHPLPHFWEQMFGSGRAVLSLRESYRTDLRQVKGATAFRFVRFHAILHDEVGVYDEDASGKPIFNFSYVDQIYDGLLQNGVRPFVELSFMPNKLAARQAPHSFWYKPNVSPPKSWEKWGELVTRLAQHLIDRYGIDEVSQWYFEVWNEPNIDFWAGDPKDETYFQLYDVAAKALKSVSPRLRVGGPATAQAAWVDRFIAHVSENRIPVDFVSTHVYGNDASMDVFGTNEVIPRDRMVCRAARKVHEQVKSSKMPELPIFFSEYNASYKTEPEVTDSEYMGPWLADTIRQCDGLLDILSYWTFSDVFEEQGVVKQPFYGGYGLIANGGVPKPAFNAFKLLHHLGQQRLAVDSQSALLTKRPDGTVVIAVWNLSDPGEAGKSEEVKLKLPGLSGTPSAMIYSLDSAHGSALQRYSEMGKPAYPTATELRELQHSAELPPPVTKKISNGEIEIGLPPKGLAILEFNP